MAADHYCVTPYFSPTERSQAPSVLVFSKTVWDGLSRRDQTIVRAAAKESVFFLRERVDAYEIAARAVAQAAGTEIIDDVDKSSFAEALLPLQQKLADSPDLRKLVQRIRTPEIATAPEPADGK